MPVYEYECAKCGRASSFLVRSIQAHRAPACPKCAHKKMTRLFSLFASSSGSRRDAGAAPSEDAGDSDFGGGAGGEGDLPDLPGIDGLDENDPRSMGRWMRQMATQVGEPLDPEMDEVCRRLESGEDPDKIEESMGDSIGDDAPGAGSDDTLYDA